MVTVRRRKSFEHVCVAAFTTRDYYSRAAFISFKSFGLCGYVNLTLEVPSLNMNVKDQEMDEETVPDMGIPGEHQHH